MADRQHGITISICAAGLGLLLLLAGHFGSLMAEKKHSPQASSRLCRDCGKFYIGNPAFCPNCGQRL
jgi:hypothetical protein